MIIKIILLLVTFYAIVILTGRRYSNMKSQINDEEFEHLNWYEQRDYRWCPECECYYHIESNHPCRNYKIEVKQ